LNAAARYPAEIVRFVARFDRREFWLAHEELEELWQQDRRDLFKGLIQLAAAFVHVERSNWSGARRLFETALDYLDGYPSPSEGFDLDRIRARARSALRQVERLQAGETQVGETQVGAAQAGKAQVGEAQAGKAQVGETQAGKAQLFGEALYFRLAPCFAGEIPADAVADVELPYRVRRHAEPRAGGPRRSGGDAEDASGAGDGETMDDAD
jgi:hypothetical protein